MASSSPSEHTEQTPPRETLRPGPKVPATSGLDPALLERMLGGTTAASACGYAYQERTVRHCLIWCWKETVYDSASTLFAGEIFP